MKRPEGLVKLHGDASNRTYWRGRRPDGGTFVVMELPEGNQSVSEEITNLKERGAELPFVNIGRFLKNGGIPVPELLEDASRERRLILEDVGDLTLAKNLEGGSAGQILRWYRKAIDLKVQLEHLKPDRSCVAFRRSFDETLFNWEFDHFLEYGLEARGIHLQEADRKIFHQQTRFITFALTRLPQLFVHRDFQSRNLMIQGERLRLIDFQDALLGPCQYDLVSLLRDSYVVLEPKTVEALIEYYLAKKPPPDAAFFRKTFDWMTVQRKLKDAGRFVYIDRVKKNPGFLPFIPASLGYVHEALERQPELQPLNDLLKRHLPEFRS